MGRLCRKSEPKKLTFFAGGIEYSRFVGLLQFSAVLFGMEKIKGGKHGRNSKSGAIIFWIAVSGHLPVYRCSFPHPLCQLQTENFFGYSCDEMEGERIAFFFSMKI